MVDFRYPRLEARQTYDKKFRPDTALRYVAKQIKDDFNRQTPSV